MSAKVRNRNLLLPSEHKIKLLYCCIFNNELTFFYYLFLVLYSGWKPVLIAMSISSLGGLILDKAVTKFNGIAVFQPLFNGVGGNLVAVQASRIATYLHLNVRYPVLCYQELL